jgi:hypothetical protein
MVIFISWLTKELGLDINLATLEEAAAGQISTSVPRAKAALAVSRD